MEAKMGDFEKKTIEELKKHQEEIEALKSEMSSCTEAYMDGVAAGIAYSRKIKEKK